MKMSKYADTSQFFSSRTEIGPSGTAYPCNSAITTKVSVLLGLVLSLLLMSETSVHAANRYVRAGATGANNGSDWTNAYTSLPATLIRGDTYYVADGSYGGYTFDDPTVDTLVITIKKATVSDHGTSLGWNNTYGDGQAIFGKLVFATNYWVIDGVTRDENDWSNGLSYGFVIAGGAGGYGAKLIDVSGVSGVTVKFTYAYFNSVKTGSDITENQDQGLYSVSGSSNITLERSFIKNISWKAAILINSSSGIYVTYNRFENIHKKELWSARSTHQVTFAYNYAKNVAGTGALVADDSDNWDIHGNIFWSPDSSYSFTDVIIGTWTGEHPSRNETLNNWKIINNTFYQINGATQIQIQKGSGNVAANNLFIGFTSSINGSITSVTNDQNASTGVVTAAVNGNFTLASATAAGTTYGAPYNTDIFGNTRGADGVWDRGGYEFNSGNPPPFSPPPLPPTTLIVE